VPHDRHTTRACHSCPAADAVGAERRAFLRDAALAVAAALTAVGGAASGAFAQPLAFTAPLDVAGDVRWYAIPAADGASIDREHEVILVRWQGAAYAFNLACPHQNTALRWQERDARFQCPKHKSKYRPDGTFIEGRATRGMDRFAVRREGDRVGVDVERLFREDRDAAGWAGAVVRL
jgi:nitrite reductase/ring-hydroxylating ferredoxin subunit